MARVEEFGFGFHGRTVFSLDIAVDEYALPSARSQVNMTPHGQWLLPFWSFHLFIGARQNITVC
jgi:hypothetical protein